MILFLQAIHTCLLLVLSPDGDSYMKSINANLFITKSDYFFSRKDKDYSFFLSFALTFELNKNDCYKLQNWLFRFFFHFKLMPSGTKFLRMFFSIRESCRRSLHYWTSDTRWCEILMKKIQTLTSFFSKTKARKDQKNKRRGNPRITWLLQKKTSEKVPYRFQEQWVSHLQKRPKYNQQFNIFAKFLRNY